MLKYHRNLYSLVSAMFVDAWGLWLCEESELTVQPWCADCAQEAA